ncbi:hypothetical protein MTo_00813 [Microcystis aeruginosa NIES-1211]|uniref:Uncharacterized protein n=1 Tax=Microcystis aeruginosa NIES-2519 TaxID=2303981 RepID=A0A5A5RG85_MICAE|nr:hypothetical protein MTo_00813 [Microcystis aeruginosa NIES-1211]GCA72187.1 hypothetical protein MiYa_03737 [Microcystis aeruginosa NIES-2519]GCA83127.1 hypothetical protein MiHa_01085 [Microcystis aeruginosa NIES-2522]GCA89012.1 hypothetical protein MiTa_02361 [Microcystis aeruginosa NIES-4264]
MRESEQLSKIIMLFKVQNAISTYNNITATMVWAHCVRPKCPIDISTKLRCTPDAADKWPSYPKSVY